MAFFRDAFWVHRLLAHHRVLDVELATLEWIPMLCGAADIHAASQTNSVLERSHPE